MGALAPLSSWIPEDDLLLKNAVEAGASLESLAKGAVQFSRKFTVRELQERWHSLLYDPIVSAEAAFRMIEFERSSSTLPSKFNRTGNSKENKHVSGKRKSESIRSCYYALRKRIHNEPFNAMDLSFLIAPNDSNYIGNENEPFPENCMLGDPVSAHFGIQESNLDIMHHTYPEMGCNADSHTFHPKFQTTVHEDYPVDQDNVHEEILHIHGNGMSDTGNISAIDEFGGPNELPAKIDQVQDCSKFDGDHVFSSPIPECAASFHNLEYSSPIPEIPLWRTVEGVSPPTIPISMRPEDSFPLSDNGDTKNTCMSEYDVHGDSNLKLAIPNEEMKHVTASTEGYLAELSNSLLNFTNEEELFTNVDGKDAIDKSYYDGLSSLLLNSPNDVNQDHMPNATEPDSSATQDYISSKHGASHGELDEDRGSQLADVVVNSDLQLPELCVEVIICTLNTEDPEIPCNDDVIFTNHLHPKSYSSLSRRHLHDTSKPNSSTFKELSNNPKSGEVVPVLMKRDLGCPGQLHAPSQIIKSHVTPEMGSLQPVDNRGINFDLPGSSTTHSNLGVANDGSSKISLKEASKETLIAAKLKEETSEVVPVKFSNDSSIEKSALGPDYYKSYPEMNASDLKQDLDAPARIQNHQAAHVKLGSTDIAAPEQVVSDPMSDPEEAPVESDDDVPYFSDVEAMILDMDLDPEDQDLYSNEEVLRYQHEDTKRLIMRLEQGAQSYMQRAIALQGAFAVLYGRHLKHYIKKPEVLLGRATEDIIVDIDLGREGRANKISRRQATISLDKSGSFHLKNLGKFSISVNEKEIGPGQSLNLTSGCLIEIRGMPFIFEINQARVKQYLDSTLKNQAQ